MNIRTITGALVLMLALMPGAAIAQTQSETQKFKRLSLQIGGGPLLKSGGYDATVSVGFAPISRLDLLVNVERHHLPFQRDTFSDGYSITRGGDLTSVSGELRASLFPPHRASPYVLAGIGRGESRPTVNEHFPNAVKNDMQNIFFGAGLRVPLKGGLTVFGDARAMMALEGDDGILGVWPVRVGLAWRF